MFTSQTQANIVLEKHFCCKIKIETNTVAYSKKYFTVDDLDKFFKQVFRQTQSLLLNLNKQIIFNLKKTALHKIINYYYIWMYATFI